MVVIANVAQPGGVYSFTNLLTMLLFTFTKYTPVGKAEMSICACSALGAWVHTVWSKRLLIVIWLMLSADVMDRIVVAGLG